MIFTAERGERAASRNRFEAFHAVGIALPPEFCYADGISVVITMLRIAICDDEPLVSDEMTALLADYMAGKPHIAYQLSRFADGPSLLAEVGGFDLIFLDIRMGPPDGMETARRLRKQDRRSLLIFVTALEEYVFDAFDVDACGYLVKPLDPSRFRRTMDRAMEALERRAGQSLLVQRGSVCEKIPLSEIVYCEVQGRKLYIHQSDGAVCDYYGRLEALEKQVDGRFFKSHRSYLVNLDYVRGCREGLVLLPQGEGIPLSRLREREFTQSLLCRMQRRDL